MSDLLAKEDKVEQVNLIKWYKDYFTWQNSFQIAFKCFIMLGVYEWIVIPFGLKNTDVTYQRAMNAIFHYLIGKNMDVYIDDVVVKSSDID